MNQQTITAVFLGILCSCACSNTTFGAAGGAEASVVEEGGVAGTGVVEASVTVPEGGAGAAGRVAVVEPEPEGGAGTGGVGGVGGEAGSAGTSGATDAGTEDVEVAHPEPCLSDDECSTDTWCRWGICTRICEQDPCYEDEACTPSSSGAPLCFPRCDVDTDCVEMADCIDGVCIDPRDLV